MEMCLETAVEDSETTPRSFLSMVPWTTARTSYRSSHVNIYIYTHVHNIYIYNMLTPAPPPPMIHRDLLRPSSGSWEVGNFRCENNARLQFPRNSHLRPRTPHRCQDFRNLGKFEPGDVFAFRALQTLGKFEPTSDAKTSPGSNFPQIPKISATMAPQST